MTTTTVLIVDDNLEEMKMMVLRYLGEEAHKFRLLWAQSGKKALEMLRTNPDIALVLSDLNMPGMSGIDLARAMETEGFKIPFILMSGDHPSEVRRQGRELYERAVIGRFLDKQFLRKDLLVAFKELLKM